MFSIFFKSTLSKLALTFVSTFIVTYIAVHVFEVSETHQQISSTFSVAISMVFWVYLFIKRTAIKNCVLSKFKILEQIHHEVK
ncbi:hypothetical protein [Photobacterium damselae]|uniref:hypothetical protein n=1 Tax=Photobacterium damselae TaxID=38293 RepID=UPI004068AA51